MPSNPHYHCSVPSNPHYDCSVPSNPHYDCSVPSNPHYDCSVPSKPHYDCSVPSNPHYHCSVPSNPHYHCSVPSNPHYHCSEAIQRHIRYCKINVDYCQKSMFWGACSKDSSNRCRTARRWDKRICVLASYTEFTLIVRKSMFYAQSTSAVILR